MSKKRLDVYIPKEAVDQMAAPKEEAKKNEPESEAEEETQFMDLSKKIVLHSRPKKEKRVKIQIEKQDSIDGMDDVKVGVNGTAYIIQRGVPVEVPESVIGVLQNSVVTKLVRNPESGDDILTDMPRILWRYVG